MAPSFKMEPSFQKKPKARSKSVPALIRQTAQALGRIQGPDGQDLVGLRARVERLTDLLIDAMFPRHADAADCGVTEYLEQAYALLALCLRQVNVPEPGEISEDLLTRLPELRQQLDRDLEAAYRGDPAATGLDEILLCYPAFRAIATYRLAHILYQQGVGLLPRIMAEYAHRRTGIDIHPGASIGERFFIDHGTGVVIGETATIGQNVKIYQHVTIGAKSFETEKDGTLIRGGKRHPDIGDRVVIYAGATILGGDTQIGDDCTIGGSVWLTHSVPAGTLVLASSAVTTTRAERSGEGDR